MVMNDHQLGKLFGRVMYTQIKYNDSVSFLTYYMFVNSAVQQNSEILLIIRN